MSRFLNELDSAKLLSKYDIPVIESRVVKGKEELETILKKMHFPVVMKILSQDIQHKTDAGCVFLNISTLEEAKDKFDLIIKNAQTYDAKAVLEGVLVQEMAEKGLEVILGMHRDPQFGPVIMVGTGGIYVEVFEDIAFRLVPLSIFDVEQMLKETKLYHVINGARGMTYDMEALMRTIMKLSQLVYENSNIEEIDINPFFLYPEGKGGKAVDALVKQS